MCSYLLIDLLTCLLIYLLTYLFTYLLTYLPTYLLTYLLTYLPTYLPTYIPTYLLTYLLTHSLTHSMEHSSFREASHFAASQEIPRILWNLKIHYLIHKCPQPVSILSQLNPVHNPTSHLLKIRLNIILPSTLGFPQWSPFLRIST
jgi:hypothetical protein